MWCSRDLSFLSIPLPAFRRAFVETLLWRTSSATRSTSPRQLRACTQTSRGSQLSSPGRLDLAGVPPSTLLPLLGCNRLLPSQVPAILGARSLCSGRTSSRRMTRSSTSRSTPSRASSSSSKADLSTLLQHTPSEAVSTSRQRSRHSLRPSQRRTRQWP
jgi:hypothetical protein